MNQNGLLHKLMLVVILVAGFGLALTLPAWKRHQDRQQALDAVRHLQQLAQQEQLFYQQNGFYTADLTPLAEPLACPPATGPEQSGLLCGSYVLTLEGADMLRASSVKYPQWFVLNISNLQVDCQYEASSPVGELLCAAVNSK